MLQRALFLDRDNTLIDDSRGYTHKPAETSLLRGSIELLKQALDNGWNLVIITNQAGIPKGKFTEADYHAFTSWLKDEFGAHGITFAGIYHCPHHPDVTGPCACRKPQPGMIQQAAAKLGLDLSLSAMIGDKASDMEAAQAAGIPTRLFYAIENEATPPSATHRIEHLLEAAPLLFPN